MKNKVLIIGGGLGGLFTGAILAKEGFEVTVLEKNAIIGGGLQTFKRWGLSYETGMHILGGLERGAQSIRYANISAYCRCLSLGMWMTTALMKSIICRTGTLTVSDRDATGL